MIPTTKKGRVEAARVLIDSHAVNEVWDHASVRELAGLTGVPLRLVIKRPNPTWRTDTRHLHVLAYDWTTPQQWSWAKAIEFGGREDADQAKQRRRLMDALRHEIREDVEDFRAGADSQRCARCSTAGDLTVDHVNPPFVQIAEEFLRRNGPMPLLPTDGGCDVIAEIAVAAEWIRFHAERACYQLLCRACNASKGARCETA